MPIETNLRIQPINSLTKSEGSQKTSSNFSNFLDKAMEDVESTEALNQEGTINLLSGHDESLHTIMIDAEKSQLALSLAIQIRNKVLDAYKEIMQMQV